jgi:predicted TIM-barrel fold metal-dependent hydrolase
VIAEIPIVDAHQHFWDPPRTPHPWLSTAPLSDFRYGDYSALRRPYLPPDFAADAKGHRVVATVHVEAEWDTQDEVGETRWLAALRAEHGLPTVAIGHARLQDPGVNEVLAGHAAFDFVRGIRQKPAAAASPREARRGAPGSMDDPRWRRGYALLERYGFSYDLQTPWWHLDAAADLAHAFPRITIIINHTGLPSDRSLEGLKAWRDALELAAAAPNVALKISGLGQRNRSWPRDGNRQIVRDAIGIFGVARCLFASNYPVDSLCVGYRPLFDDFKRFAADRPPAERTALFHDNAVRLYRIADAGAPSTGSDAERH